MGRLDQTVKTARPHKKGNPCDSLNHTDFLLDARFFFILFYLL